MRREGHPQQCGDRPALGRAAGQQRGDERRETDLEPEPEGKRVSGDHRGPLRPRRRVTQPLIVQSPAYQLPVKPQLFGGTT